MSTGGSKNSLEPCPKSKPILRHLRVTILNCAKSQSTCYNRTDYPTPSTEAEDMDYAFSSSNKRKIGSTHTQRPNHAIQFNNQPFIPPVVINLVSEPKAFNLLSFVEKQHFTKELSAIIVPISSNTKWSKSNLISVVGANPTVFHGYDC